MTALTVYETGRHLAHSQPAESLVALGRANGWQFAVLGIAPMPTETILLPEWEIVPAHLDNSHIPSRALERIRAIYEAGYRPKGFVVAHEQPREATSMPVVSIASQTQELVFDVDQVLQVSGTLIKAIAVATAGLMGVILPAIFAIGSAVLLDPILVAVTEDNVWVEIDRWWD